MILFQDALEATKSLFLRELDNYAIIGPMPLGPVHPGLLPIKDLNVLAPSIKHFVDLIEDYDGAVNYEQLRPIMRDLALNELPEPFSTPSVPTFAYKLQLFILPQPNGNYTVLKHFYLPSDKVKAVTVLPLIRGKGYEVSWGNNIKNTRKAFQFMLEQMGGMQYRTNCLSAERKRQAAKGPQSKNEEDLDAGFDFILKSGNRDKAELGQLRWVVKEIANESSPIYGWHKGLVQEALTQLATDGTLAKTVTTFPLTVIDLQDWFAVILESLVPHCMDKSVWFLGEPGVGKTLVARLLAMMWSRYHGGNGSLKTANDMDFFRGAAFTKMIPALFDDGDIHLQAVAKLKAFSDVSDEESITRERWTAAKFVQGQLRLVCDNKYEHLPHLEESEAKEVTHADFMDLIKPAMPADATRTNAMALLKRAIIIVNSKKWLYFRAPGEDERPVPRERFHGKPDFFKNESKPVIAGYKKGKKEMPEGHDAAIAWEQTWLKEALRKSELGAAPAAASAAAAPSSQPWPMRAERSVKMEIDKDTFFAHSYGLMMACGGPGGEVIEVDSPPRKRVKVEDVSYHKEWKAEAFAKLHRQLSMQTRGKAITIADSQEFDLEKELEHGMDDSQGLADQQEEPTPPDEPAVQEAGGPWSQEPTA